MRTQQDVDEATLALVRHMSSAASASKITEIRCRTCGHMENVWCGADEKPDTEFLIWKMKQHTKECVGGVQR